MEKYLALVPSQHLESPKFIATLTATLAPFVYAQSVLNGLTEQFDLDVAEGQQLDILGEWIGIKRGVDVPISNYYFTWAGTVQTGWGSGFWLGIGDPLTYSSDLPDQVYRSLLKSKALSNRWNGSIPMMYEIIDTFTGVPGSVLITDNQDMSFTLTVDSTQLNALYLAVLVNGYLLIQPQGIEIIYTVI